MPASQNESFKPVRQGTAHGVVRSIGDQLLQTVRRPSRLFFGPLSFLIFKLQRVPPLAALVLRILPDRWLAGGRWRAICFASGYKLFQLDRPGQAWPWLERVLRVGRPTTDEFLVGAMCLYHGLGRFRDAVSLLARANAFGVAEAEQRGLGKIPFRVIDSVWARHIGHTATLDYVVKLGILEGRRRDDTIMYLPPGSPVANRVLLQQISAHLRLVERDTDLPFPASAVQALHYDYLGPRLPDGTTAYFWEIAGKTYQRWHAARRGPLLSLPADIEARGWAALQSAGVPKGAWFVALHVREGKWDGPDAGIHGMLNADIATYSPAIAAITGRGGWVVRMGDPGMTRLSPQANVVDYCHSALRADWMDIFLAARCRFMLGTSSGPAYIPPLYGVPCVLTNWWPLAQRPWHAADLFVPKMPRRTADGRYLTLSETLCEPFSYCHSRRNLADHGVLVENNDAEVIRAAVEEMLARLDGDTQNEVETEQLRERAGEIYEAHNAFGMGELARAFLRRYGDLIV